MPAAITEKALALIEDLPPFLVDSYDIRAVLAALSNEIDRIDAAIEEIRDNFYPQRGEKYLKAWESLLGVAIEPPDKTLAQRRVSVLAILQSLKTSGSGLSWEAALSQLIGTSWSYAEHDPAVPTSPPAHTLKFTIPFGSPLSVPTGLAKSSFTTGGTLAAATYYYVVTAINSYGETTPSTELAVTNTGSTSRNVLTWNAVTDATGYRIYRGTTSGVWRLLATNLTATATYNDTGIATGTQQPPTVNSTSSPQAYEAERLARQITPAHLDLVFGYGAGFIVGVSQVGEEPI